MKILGSFGIAVVLALAPSILSAAGEMEAHQFHPGRVLEHDGEGHGHRLQNARRNAHGF